MRLRNGLFAARQVRILFGTMIAALRERIRQWWFSRDMLIVSFGSGPGRIPLVILSRGEVADVCQHGMRVSFSSRSPDHVGWKFAIHTKTPAAAESIARELNERRCHVLEPRDDIGCITHARPEAGGVTQPRLIGGDILLAGVREQEYWRHGNGGWMLKAVFTEPTTTTSGDAATSPSNSGVSEGAKSLS